MKKFCIILGTRPEIIKLSPLIALFQKKKVDFFILHTNQHYSPSLDAIFFRELRLPKARYNLKVGSGTHAEVTGNALIGCEKILKKEKPDCVIVQGDTNTVLAGALAAAKLHIPVAHVEAGLRSYFRGMPEEINRVMADHIADMLFCPTVRDKKILLHEGIEAKKIVVTGNTIVDVVNAQLPFSRTSDILKKLGISKKHYILVTAHREENVDSPKRLVGILEGIDHVAKKTGLKVIYPMHLRTRKRLEQMGLAVPPTIRAVEPIGFHDFLWLQQNARLVITDSGGIQEEDCIMGVPCVTVRDNTERMETIEIGSNMLAGTDPKRIERAATTMLSKKKKWQHPYGDGTAAEKIWTYLKQA